MKRVHIIGLGAKREDTPNSLLSIINGADILVGGRRFLEQFSDFEGEKIIIKSPVDDVIYKIKELSMKNKKVVVLSGGDPLFYGIGRRLIDIVGEERVEIVPGVTTVQIACARARLPREEMKTVSIHGRDNIWPLLRAISFHDLIGVYTGGSDGPRIISEVLKERGVDEFKIMVFEDLGLETERIREIEISDVSGLEFSPLNFVILKRIKSCAISPGIGIDDKHYEHERGLITKREIRVVGISLLNIMSHSTVWDLGAGCGAVSIESAYLARDGMVFSVEKSPERVEQIIRNRKRFGLHHVEVIHGIMPHCLGSLPAPDRVFLGGGLSGGEGLLEKIFSCLKPGGKFVAHTVLLNSLGMVKGFLEKRGIPYEVILLQAARSNELSGDIRLSSLNPVFIISARKSDAGDINE